MQKKKSFYGNDVPTFHLEQHTMCFIHSGYYTVPWVYKIEQIPYLQVEKTNNIHPINDIYNCNQDSR